MRHRLHQELTPDALEELSHAAAAGADSAAIALSALTGFEIRSRRSGARVVPVPDVPTGMGGEQAAVVAIQMTFPPDSRGGLLVLLGEEAACGLLDALLPGRAPGAPVAAGAMPPMERSGLLETANILAGAYLHGIDRTGKSGLLPGVPSLACDMVGAVVDTLLVNAAQGADRALVVDCELARVAHLAPASFSQPAPPTDAVTGEPAARLVLLLTLEALARLLGARDASSDGDTRNSR